MGSGMVDEGGAMSLEARTDSKPRKYRVVTAYRSAYPEPFVVRAGESLTAGEKESEWPGWVWCTDRHGDSRWVPEEYLRKQGEKLIALRDYDATELTVCAGQELTARDQVSGWTWCTNREGRSGWVPADCLAAEPGEE